MTNTVLDRVGARFTGIVIGAMQLLLMIVITIAVVTADRATRVPYLTSGHASKGEPHAPKQACEVLQMDMAINMALPCRISIYEEKGKTFIGMVPPSVLLGLISSSSELKEAAAGVEQTTRQIIDDAV